MIKTMFGCELVAPLYAGPRSVLYRGRRERDGARVVIKTPAGAPPHAERIAALQWEFEVLRRVRGAEGALEALSLERAGGTWGLIVHDDETSCLRESVLCGTVSIADFLRLALALTGALEGLHRRAVVHRDLHPGNVLIDLARGKVTLIDLASASLVGSLREPLPARKGSSNSFAYLAPEETGRIRRAIDYRTDYYALGAVLYELLTGAPPFDYDDPLELVHAHVARKPAAPHTLRAGVSDALSAVLLKLLAKDADQRYQTLSGLRHDLERCAPVLGSKATFEVGARDRAGRLKLGDQLYGREPLGQRLSVGFERVRGGAARIVTLTGPAGIGKTSVLRQWVAEQAKQGGYFAFGKFPQYESEVPHVALRQVLEHLLAQLLSEHAESVAAWRSRMLASVPAPQLLLELCPSFERLLGPQRALPALGSSESRARVQQVANELFRIVASPEHPLCLVLDDAQWAPPDSLHLLREVVFGLRSSPVLVVLSYREDELAEDHPLRALLCALAAEWVPIEPLTLEPLTLEQVGELIAASLALQAPEARELAQIVWARTRGNPLFVRAFLESIEEEGLLAGAGEGERLDFEGIARQGVTDNVVDLLVKRIRHLPPASQALLGAAACIGSRFDLEKFGLLGGASLDQLTPALRAELILPLDAIDPAAPEPPPSSRFRFAHDRVQQAVLSTLAADAQRALHLRLGSRWLSGLDEEPEGGTLFELVRHLNLAEPLISASDERARLARLDLHAARAALASGATNHALELARAGLVAAGEPRAEPERAVLVALSLSELEACLALGDHEAVHARGRALGERARPGLEAARVHCLRAQAHHASFQLADAIASYLAALRELGAVLPPVPDAAALERARAEAEQAIAPHSIAALRALPECADPHARAAIGILSKLMQCAGSAASPLFPLAVWRSVALSIGAGHCADSAHGYIFYGLLLSREGKVNEAHELGQLALHLAETLGDRGSLAFATLFANFLLSHWKVSLGELAPRFRSAHRHALEAGCPHEAANAATTTGICRFLAGHPLDELSQEMRELREVAVRYRQALVLNWHDVYLQAVTNLRSEQIEATRFEGPWYEESSRLAAHEAAGDHSSIFNYRLVKSLLCYLLGSPQEALAHSEVVQRFADLFGTGVFAIPMAYFDALCRLAAAAGAEGGERDALLERAAAQLERLRGWASYNPGAVAHKLQTLEAELARQRADVERASVLFKEAVILARASGAPHEEGIACELAGRASLGRGDIGAARRYLRAAQRAFYRWGALAKTRALERDHPQLLRPLAAELLGVPSLAARNPQLELLDVLSVAAASRAISSEIKRDRLLERLLTLLIEAAGAEFGYLLLRRGDNWVVEAGRTTNLSVATLAAIPIPELAARGYPSVSQAIVHYVASAGQAVSLDDPELAARFVHDPHLGPQRSGSLLCFPLKRGGEVVAVAYLENSLARNVFTADSLTLLELLSAQAVISLENVRLYEELEQQVQARTRELEERNEQLARTLARLLELQQQLVTQEKLAALGALTAGIAHEIKNPLNFVLNFAELSEQIADELSAQLNARGRGPGTSGAEQLASDLRSTVRKIGEHGRRATAIVNGMALHSRRGGGVRELADLNSLLMQSVQLANSGAYASARCPVRTTTRLDPGAGEVDVIVQDISRVFVNLVTNAQHALRDKHQLRGASFVPELVLTTRALRDRVQIRVWDNGSGIKHDLRDKVFLPFFTTKPSGQGTGLGLSISYDIIVRGHAGSLRLDSVEGEYTEFTIELPRARPAGEPLAGS